MLGPTGNGEALSNYFLLTALLTFCVTFARTSAAASTGTPLLRSANTARGTADAFHAALLCSYDIRDCSAQDSDKHCNQYHIFHGPLLSA